MARDLKIFGCSLPGPMRGVVAAKNATEAASLMGVSLNFLNANGGETWNATEANVALASPGVVFAGPLGASSYSDYLPRGAYEAKVEADRKAHYEAVLKAGKR